MTERSYVWNGTVGGDATLAPYNRSEFNPYLFASLCSYGSSTYVVPGYLDELRVDYSSDNIYSVTINSGAALIKNFLYVQDEPITLSLSSVSGYRIDRVVLRIDYLKQTIVPAIIEGSAHSAFTYTSVLKGSLTQIEEILWEGELAQVLVTSTSVESVSGDRRLFLVNARAKTTPNHIRNSEFLVFTQTGTGNSPEYWESVGSPDTNVALPSTQARGYSIYLVANESLTQTIPVDSSIYHTVSIHTLVISAFCIKIKLRGRKLNGAYTDYIISNSMFNDDVFLTHTFTDLISEIEITLEPITTGYVGQVVCRLEHYTGNNQFITDIIPFRDVLTDANWDGDAKSTVQTVIDFSVDYGPTIRNGSFGAFVRLEGRDSSALTNVTKSLTAECSPVNFADYGILECGGLGADYLRSLTCIVPLNFATHRSSLSPAQMRLSVVATGAGTLDAWAELVGLLT